MTSHEDEETYSDVDWLDEEPDVKSPRDTDDLSDTEEKEEVVLTVAIGDRKADQQDTSHNKRKRSPVIYTEDDHSKALDRHKTDLSLGMFRAQSNSTVCSDDFLGASLISLLPPDIISAVGSGVGNQENRDGALSLIRWFRSDFKAKVFDDASLTEDEGRDGSDADELISRVLANRAGSPQQVNQLFIALLRTLGFQVRYVCTIDPRGWSAKDHSDITERRMKSIEKQKSKRQNSGNSLIATTSSGGSSSKSTGSGKDVSDAIDITATATATAGDDDDDVSDDCTSHDGTNQSYTFKSSGRSSASHTVDLTEVISAVGSRSGSQGINRHCSRQGGFIVQQAWAEVLLSMPLDSNPSADTSACADPTNHLNADGGSEISSKSSKKLKGNRRRIMKKLGMKSGKRGGSSNAVEETEERVQNGDDDYVSGNCIGNDHHTTSSCDGSSNSNIERFGGMLNLTRDAAVSPALSTDTVLADDTPTAADASNINTSTSIGKGAVDAYARAVVSTVDASTSAHATLVVNDDADDDVVFVPSSPLSEGVSLSSVAQSQGKAATDAIEIQDDSDVEGDDEQEVMVVDGCSAAGAAAAMPVETHRRRWVHVDAVRNMFDVPHRVEAVLRRKCRRAFTYIIAVDGTDSRCTDVTGRYATRPMLTERQRLPHPHSSWWTDLLLSTAPRKSSASTSASASVSASSSSSSLTLSRKELRQQQQLDRQEQEELEEAAVRYRLPMPKTLAEFKDHPIYRLKRLIRADEAINPTTTLRSLIGAFNGEPVYLASHIEQLRTKRQWRMQMRAVKEGEAPCKTVKRKRGESSVDLPLYGSWQTSEFQVPAVRDGVIPVNEHGNVEVWDFAESLVPKGARLVPSKLALKVAESLGLPCAPAIVGFDNKGSHTAPRIGGAVVLDCHYDIISEAVGNVEVDRQEKAEEKKSKEILEKWTKLVKSVMQRQRLREKYGH